MNLTQNSPLSLDEVDNTVQLLELSLMPKVRRAPPVIREQLRAAIADGLMPVLWVMWHPSHQMMAMILLKDPEDQKTTRLGWLESWEQDAPTLLGIRTWSTVTEKAKRLRDLRQALAAAKLA